MKFYDVRSVVAKPFNAGKHDGASEHAYKPFSTRIIKWYNLQLVIEMGLG